MKFKPFGSSGVEVSAIGQGSMGVGGKFTVDKEHDKEQIAALKFGIDSGMTFIDTAEVYGAGHSEEVIGEAIKGMRGKVFISTKFSPEHNARQNVVAAVDRSLARLKTDYIDLYQIHWPNPAIPVEETLLAMEDLVDAGKIRYIGVSNFSLSQLKEAQAAMTKYKIVSNQVEYNLFDRSIEKDLLPYCEAENIAIIAYSPLDQGKAAQGGGVLEKIAAKYNKTPSQITLNWLASKPNVFPIPKAMRPEHIVQNAEAVDFEMSADDIKTIDTGVRHETVMIPVDKIEVSVQGEGARKVYQTKEEAIENRLKFTPSPLELAAHIRANTDEEIKPVRLTKAVAKDGKADYDLVEGRVRYWAWVIAFDGKKPIPALIREI